MAEDLSPSEVARLLSTSTRSVQRWIATGRLPARRVGGRWRVASDALGAFSPVIAPVGASDAPARARVRRLFIANRGEIAVRIARTCDAIGITAVVPPTDGPAALDLLDIGAVVTAAVASGADALHPGFGFLAENAAFAQAVVDAGLRWVGPPPGAITTMGDKAAARRLAESLGVPVPPGDDGVDQSDGALARAADRIGLPLLIKPAGGGGGKGMRTVRLPEQLVGELAAARREALAAFGDDRLILERLVDGARHVEVQVLFDAYGAGVHLGERDCSLQRRNQKILEESPAPHLDDGTRRSLTDAAVRLAAAVGYVNAGTCEFLVDERGAVTFLEMNPRLQVEHPVTEMVVGRDLVADQLAIAAGRPLPFQQEDVTTTGHAVEVRLYAEDAEDGFLPATGRIVRLRWPAGPGIRVDAGIAEGDEVTGRFDPMLAKIIAHGRDREEAFERLTAALDATVILGLTTNLRFLRWVVREPVVLEGRIRTDTLDRIWPPSDWAERSRVPDEVRAAAAAALLEAAPRIGDPWAGGWRLNAAPTATIEVDGDRMTVAPQADTSLTLAIDGETAHVDVAGRSVAVRLAVPPDVDRAARAAVAHTGDGPSELSAPMPGRVVTVHVRIGDVVEAGVPVITLEAMKMEHVVPAPRAGSVTELLVEVGDQVQRGQRVAVVEA